MTEQVPPLKSLAPDRCIACGSTAGVRVDSRFGIPICETCPTVTNPVEISNMPRLSMGAPSTLGNWLVLTESVYGDDSAPVRYLTRKIRQSPKGRAEPVIASESQLLYALGRMMIEGVEDPS